MTVNKIIGLALLGILSTSHSNAATTLTEWGAIATLSNSTCASDYCGDVLDLGFFTNLSVNQITGGVGNANASAATGSWPAPDSAQASGTVVGDLSVPLLTAGAASDVNTWNAGQSLVVQGYDYTGGGPDSLQLDWELSGDIVNPDDDPITGLAVFVGLFKSDALLFPNINDPLVAFNLLVGVAIQSPEDNVLEFTDDGPVFGQGTLSIDVDDGDQFYLAMGLMAAAGGDGAIAESLSTLTASFDGNPSLAPAITAVPVPPAVWLLGSGLLGLVGIATRKKAV